MVLRILLIILVGAMLGVTGVSATAARQTPLPPQLYFVAIGDVPPAMIDGLVSHFQAKYGMAIKTLLPLALDESTVDPQRKQLVADKLIQAVRFRNASLAKRPETRVIAITPSDMFMEAMREKWSFTFSLRSRDQRFAVVSYARMNPAALGAAPNEELMSSRLRKMIAKNIGIIYYALPLSKNPRSVLYGNVLSVDDLDRMTEEFDPR